MIDFIVIITATEPNKLKWKTQVTVGGPMHCLRIGPRTDNEATLFVLTVDGYRVLLSWNTSACINLTLVVLSIL